MHREARLSNTLRNDAYRELIESLTQARRDAGLTQQEIADRLEKPQSYVAKAEGFERRLDVIEFLQMSTAIGVDGVRLVRKIADHPAINN